MSRIYHNKALEYACAEGHKDIVLSLIQENKFDVNANYGRALELAALHGRKDIVNILLRAGAKATFKEPEEEVNKENCSINLKRSLRKLLNFSIRNKAE